MVSKNPDETPEATVRRKRVSFRSKKGLGFDLNEQANGTFDFVVLKGNKPLFHINVSAEFIQALKKKLEGA